MSHFANRLNGNKSKTNRNSRLAKLVAYVQMTTEHGGKATRFGFAQTQHSTSPRVYGKDIVRLAAEDGYITITEERDARQNKILIPGPNAKHVTTVMGEFGFKAKSRR